MRPSQYVQDAVRRTAEPQRRLMAAVLQTVLDDFRGSAYRHRAGYAPTADVSRLRHAAAYVTSADRSWPFSFENICDALGLDADDVRAELLGPRGVGARTA
jgi:hypothetical protein